MPFYFAYGSNMQSATLRGRRGIVYRRALPARVLGWRLTIDKPSLLGVGGAFANIVEDAQASVLGVLFEISETDLEHLEMTEGVLVGNYQSVIVSAQALAAPDAEVLSAHSLASDRRDTSLRPTSRYMQLLIDGAIEHGLPVEHVDYLRGIPVGEETAASLAMRRHIDAFMKR